MNDPEFSAERDPFRCEMCGLCERLVACSRVLQRGPRACTGCGACALVCPNEAVRMVEHQRHGQVAIRVDGEAVSVPEQITVKRALELLGFRFGAYPGDGDFFAPCGVGGCYSCAVTIDGELLPSCVTAVREGMEITTDPPDTPALKRRVDGWMGHGVGGVGTPWQEKRTRGYVETAVFACGCNLRCPQCQNFKITYNGVARALTPDEAAIRMTLARRHYRVDRMAISGGESTLNRRWLVSYLQQLKAMNPDAGARFHVDTNATILSKDYIDELVLAGMTDIGPDLKGLETETFMRITGMQDRDLAERCHQTAWNAVEYLVGRYSGTVFTGIGIPYNPALISREEVAAMGERLGGIDPGIQVCVLDYRPAFRRMNLLRPSLSEMDEIGAILRGAGLNTVVCQTPAGHIGP